MVGRELRLVCFATVIAVVAMTGGAASGGSSARGGELRQLAGKQGCIALRGPCGIGRALDYATGIDISPDGRSVYVAAAGVQGGVAVFRRAGGGALTQLAGPAGCVTATGSGGKCSRAASVGGAQSVVVSPDGKNVYVLAGQVSVFSRSTATGALRLVGCIGGDGCAPARGVTAGGASGGLGALAVSPDGRHVYITSHRERTTEAAGQFDEGAIAAFARDRSSGALKQLAGEAGCVSQGGYDGCAGSSLLGTLASIAIAPDGKSVYVVSENNSEDNPKPDALIAYTRGANGALAQRTCFTRTARAGCTTGEAIFSPLSVTVSPDSKNVYVGALQTAALVTFAASGGTLRQIGCLGLSFIPSCSSNRDLSLPSAIAVSKDGQNLYVTYKAPDQSAVAALTRGPDGKPGFLSGRAGCLAESRLPTCGTARGLGGAASIDVSPDGKNVYIASLRDSAVVVFARG